MRQNRPAAFSLVELSIVLVILGLLVGGILAGKSLITAAGLRAQIEQIDKYRTAAYTFRDKYTYLPGDLPDDIATRLGFTAVTANGDGSINGWAGGGTLTGFVQRGEPVTFWQHLSAPAVAMIEGNFTADTTTITAGTASVPLYYPAAKLPGLSVYVWSCNPTHGICSDGNFMTVSNIQVNAGNTIAPNGASNFMAVEQAWNIDNKVDDGKPRNGSVVASHLNTGSAWSYSTAGASNGVACIQNTSTDPIYATPNPNEKSCSLSFRF